ncbi:alpha/beta hydrolase [Marinobacter nauticus]|uniref:Alpha/beta hydrolase n=2 Tax=Marinobacter nauticus TaxID=2743 RepID=A0A1M2V1N9_MARNT|nr:alpha/beta hydrolase [Marinobacter nauticus]
MLLAHGAGAPMDSPFMEHLSEALERHGVATVRFEFPYMARRREDGRKRPPDRMPVLLDSFRAEVARVRDEVGEDCLILVGGKSMGGRVASMLASDNAPDISGVICYGYPFHPPGKPDRWRIDHFSTVGCPMMIIQGTRDPFGKPEEVAAQGEMPGLSRLRWLDGGNHDFQTPARHPGSQATLIEQAASETGRFIQELLAGSELH